MCEVVCAKFFSNAPQMLSKKNRRQAHLAAVRSNKIRGDRNASRAQKQSTQPPPEIEGAVQPSFLYITHAPRRLYAGPSALASTRLHVASSAWLWKVQE